MNESSRGTLLMRSVLKYIRCFVTHCYVSLLLSLIVLTGLMVSPASAQPLNAPLMNATTPVNINGVIDPLEWENAGATARTFALQDFDGTTRTVTVYALHDNTNVYLGFKVEDQSRVDDPTSGTKDDGIVLLFDPGAGAPDKSGTILADDIGYSFFVSPNAATPSLTDAKVTGNTHTPSGGAWSTTAGMPSGGVNAQFSNVNPGTGEQGWQMEILIPFTALNGIDPYTQSQIGFAFFILNDWGDTSGNGLIGNNDKDGFLAFPTGLAGALTVGMPIITPANPVSSLVNSGNFKVPSSWETITLVHPQILVTPTSFNFGAVRKNTTSTPIWLSVQNTGTAGTTLKYTLPALSAPYSYTALGTPNPGVEHTLLSGAAAHTYQIQFSPTVEGVVPTQTMTITSNDQNVDFTLNGEGGLSHLVITNATTGALPTLTLDFEEVTINTPKTIGLMIGNTGTVPLNVTNITKTGSGTVSGPNLGGATNHLDNIVSGTPQALTIICNPTSVGTFSAVVKFDTDDPAYQIAGTGNDITVNVTCEGVTREIVLALDASGSMRVRTPDGTQTAEFNSSRWKDLEQQVSLFTQVLTEHGAGMGTFNGVLFPNKDDTAETGLVFSSMRSISASNKTQFDTALSSVPRMGLRLNYGTPLGAGLRDAVNQFATASSRRALVLFSDGAQNFGPPPSDFYTAAENSKARIYTIGYGVRGSSEVDLDLLAKIAALSERSGEDNSFEVNSDELFDLNKTIKYILEDDLGLDLLDDPEGTIYAGQQITREVTVSDMAKQLYFHVSWNTYQADRLQVDLITPDCQLITPSTAASDARVRYLSQQKFKTYTIKGSLVKEGKWKVVVRAPRTLSAGEPYSYGLMGDTRLRLDPVFSKSTYFTGDEIKIKAVLQGNGMPMKNAIVYMTVDSPKASLSNWLALNYVSPQLMANVQAPVLDELEKKKVSPITAAGASQPAATAAPVVPAFETHTMLAKKAYVLKNVIGINPPLEMTTSRIYLYDDGVTGGDEIANDGIYTATVKNTTVAGTYDFRIYANGKTPGGYDFTREAHAQRQVNVGWNIKDINLHYDFTRQSIKEQYHDVVVVSISGKDAYGNVAVNNQIIKDLHINVVNGSPWGAVSNNGDGSYSQTILLEDPKKSPRISVSYKEQPVVRDYELPVVSGLTFVNEVVNYKAGKEGNEGFNEHTKPEAALGAPAKNKFVSLGAGGSLTVAVKGKEIYDGPGPDIVVYETAKLPNQFETPDSYTVEVLTKDGYVNLGTVQGGIAQFDLADKKISRATTIRITDTSGRVADYNGMAIHTPGADIEAVGVKYVRDRCLFWRFWEFLKFWKKE